MIEYSRNMSFAIDNKEIRKMLWKDGKKKALTLSYDDGTIHDRRFIDLLNKYGIPCTFNLVSGVLKDEKFEIDYSETPIEDHKWVPVAKFEVPELYKNHEVASHTVTHPNLLKCTDEEINKEITDDRKALQKLTNQEVTGFAYPYGAWDDELTKKLEKLGIVYARNVGETHNFGIPENFLSWNPTCHHDDPELKNLIKKFLESDNEGDLFYLWGHSYEFYINNNWELIEEFLKIMSEHKDEIWFATNLEIYNYIQENK